MMLGQYPDPDPHLKSERRIYETSRLSQDGKHEKTAFEACRRKQRHKVEELIADPSNHRIELCDITNITDLQPDADTGVEVCLVGESMMDKLDTMPNVRRRYLEFDHANVRRDPDPSTLLIGNSIG